MLRDPDLLIGLTWGVPRPGHPEGSVARHVADLWARILPAERRRADLRVVALVHDSFKDRTRPDRPHVGSNDHALLARQFAERYLDDEAVLATIGLHEEPWWLWRHRDAMIDWALDALIARLPDSGLYLRFVTLDQTAPGKDAAPLAWFRRELRRRRRRPSTGVSSGHDSCCAPAATRSAPAA
jgi:hypothetical protein